MQLLLATSDSRFAVLLIGAAIATVVALLASFWPAWHGHWLAPALAIPALLGGLLLFVLFAGPHSDAMVKLIAALPTLLALGSLALWWRKRRTRPHDRDGDGAKG